MYLFWCGTICFRFFVLISYKTNLLSNPSSLSLHCTQISGTWNALQGGLAEALLLGLFIHTWIEVKTKEPRYDLGTSSSNIRYETYIPMHNGRKTLIAEGNRSIYFTQKDTPYFFFFSLSFKRFIGIPFQEKVDRPPCRKKREKWLIFCY